MSNRRLGILIAIGMLTLVASAMMHRKWGDYRHPEVVRETPPANITDR